MNYRGMLRNTHWLFPFVLFIAQVGWMPNTAWASNPCSADVEVTAVLSFDPGSSELDSYATAIENGYQWAEDCGNGIVGVEGDLYKAGSKIDWAIDAEGYSSAEATMVDPFTSGYSYTLRATAYFCDDAADGSGDTDQGTWLQGCYPFSDGNDKAFATYP